MKRFLPLCLLTLISGCDLGSGSKLVSLEITGPTGAAIPAGTAYPLYTCFRDRLNVIGRFSDGSSGNFSTRVSWSSSDTNVVRVLGNAERNTRAVFSKDSGMTVGFNDVNQAYYSTGVLIPKGIPGSSAIVTASFIGLTASVRVEIKDTALSIDTSPITTPAAVTSAATGVGFSRSLTVRAVIGGQTVDAALRRLDPATLELLNPILWKFVDSNGNDVGTFSQGRAASTASLDREDLYLFPAGSTRTTTDPAASSPTDQQASLNPGFGVLRGVSPTATPKVLAFFDTTTTPGDAGVPTSCAIPAANALSVPIETVTSITIGHETDFNGPGAAATGDLVIGTDENLKTIATLDNGTQTPDMQDVSTQVGYEVDPADRDFCVPNAADCSAANRISSILTFTFNQMSTVPGTNGSFVTNTTLNGTDTRFTQDNLVNTVKVHSCFPSCTAATLTSDNLEIRAIPATLTSYGSVTPVATATDPNPNTGSQMAFTFPGRQFSTVGMFTAIPSDGLTPANGGKYGGSNFGGRDDNQAGAGTNVTGQQNVSRYMSWAARPADLTLSTIVSLFGMYNSSTYSGQAYYLRNPEISETPATVTVNATPLLSTKLGQVPGASAVTSPPATSNLVITRCTSAQIASCPDN